MENYESVSQYVVAELVPLRGEATRTKQASRYLSTWIRFKIFDEPTHPCM